MKALSDEQMRAKTLEFKDRLANGESFDDLIPEVFALVREASVRALGMSISTLSLSADWFCIIGKIAEMKTGEGKTLARRSRSASTLLLAGGHIVYGKRLPGSARREWMGAIYNFLGLSVGVIVHDLDDEQRRAAYNADITYGTNNEFGFDYLRDNMKFSLADYVQRELHYAIVDEVDSISG